MGKIFGISDLPVAKPFPSLDFELNSVKKPNEVVQPIIRNTDKFIKKDAPKQRFLKQFFSRIKH